jgi:hypothetical protein
LGSECDNEDLPLTVVKPTTIVSPKGRSAASRLIQSHRRHEQGQSDPIRLAPFNIKVKLVEPGYAPTTRFTANVGSRMDGLFPETRTIRRRASDFQPALTRWH